MNINVKGTVLLYHVTRNKIYEVKEFLREKMREIPISSRTP